MPSETLIKIRTMLDERGIEYRCLTHEPTRTSEESARVRGEPVEIGGKALLVKIDDQFRLFVLSAALRFDSATVKKRFNARKIRFASAEELMDMTGLVPGSVPPFGEPILPFPLLIDASITQNDRIAFNAGSLTDSVIMAVDDYLSVAAGDVSTFTRPAD